MSDRDWMGPANDRLREVGLDAAADWIDMARPIVRAANIAGEDLRMGDVLTRGEDELLYRYAAHSSGPPAGVAREDTPKGSRASLTPPIRWNEVRNPYQDAIDIAPMVERESNRERQRVEAWLIENNADPETHEHVIYSDPASPMGGRIHVLMPKPDVPTGALRMPVERAMIRYPYLRTRF